MRVTKQQEKQLVDAIEVIWDRARDESRHLTEAEHVQVKALTSEVEEIQGQRDINEQIKALGSRGAFRGLGESDAGGPGDLFVKSEQWRRLADPGSRGQRWSTGVVEVGGGWMTKGTLLEGAGAPGSGTGGGFLTSPTVVPGVVSKLFQRLTVADLLPSQQVTTNTIRYIVEGTATSGAAGVAEGGDKPQSTLGYSTVDEPVKKIATTLIVSDEMLDDGGVSIQQYLNSRLSLFVETEQDRQLLRGAGTNELYGLMASARGINYYGGGTAVGNKAVQIFKALNGTRGSSFLEPDAIIMHPTDWEAIRLLTDTAGQFFGGGPFQGPYGNGTQFQASGYATGANDSLWGKPVILNSTVGAGTAVLGSFGQGAMLGRRTGLTVEATNSHDDLFTKNLVAIRAELRVGLCVYRPSAFTEVRLA